jgi:transposase
LTKREHTYTAEEVKAVLALATKRLGSMEAVAHRVQRSYATVYRWSQGKSVPNLGDYTLLKNIVK